MSSNGFISASRRKFSSEIMLPHNYNSPSTPATPSPKNVELNALFRNNCHGRVRHNDVTVAPPSDDIILGDCRVSSMAGGKSNATNRNHYCFAPTKPYPRMRERLLMNVRQLQPGLRHNLLIGLRLIIRHRLIDAAVD